MELNPAIPTIGFFVCVVLFLPLMMLMRYLSYRERIAMIEKGMNPRERFPSDGKDLLRWGIATTLLGVALSISLYSIGFMPWSGGETLPLRIGPWMIGGFIPLFFGLALILSYYLTREPPRPVSAPPPEQD